MFLEKIHNRRNQKWIDIEKMKDSRLPLVLYGAGINAVLCAKFLKKHFIRFDAICVTGKNNTAPDLFFEGMPVITLKEVGDEFGQFNCLIAFADIVTAKKNLSQQAGVREVFVIDNPDVVEDINYLFLKNNEEAFANTYNLLADKLSKDAFIDFLNTRISGVPFLSNSDFEQQYFCDILPLDSEESLVDCGAYDGDTIFSFIERTAGFYNHIYAFEPDARNFQKLMYNVKYRKIEKIKLIQKGVWERKEVLNFSSPVSPAGHISPDGSCQIEVDSIDNMVADGKATIIKMDIEGAELHALKGAKSIIAKDKPKLAISVYHKAEDLISIPPYLAENLPEYKFYLRRHSCFSLETVFYAIPNNKRNL